MRRPDAAVDPDMLKDISRYFQQHLRRDEAAAGRAPEAQLRLATAALLIEMTRADHDVTDAERAAVVGSLQGYFGLEDAETRELVELAELEARTSASLFQFTHLIDRHFTLEEKIAIVELLWGVAYADMARHHQEEHLVRKIADLLHVPHSAFIRARENAAAAAKR